MYCLEQIVRIPTRVTDFKYVITIEYIYITDVDHSI